MNQDSLPLAFGRHFQHALSTWEKMAESATIDWMTIEFFRLDDDPRHVLAAFVDTPRDYVIGESMRSGFCSAVCEIVSNAIIHSESACGACIASEYWPAGDRLDVVIYDAGVGFRDKIVRREKREMTAAESIEWAMHEGNAVNETWRPGPSGLGLKETADFMRRNQGIMEILTGNAFWRLAGGRTGVREVAGEIAGTFVRLSFNMANNYSYLKRLEAINGITERQMNEDLNPNR